MPSQTTARILHDVGGAAWFGGALMGATALNRASGAVSADDRVTVADAGWQAWRPWKVAAIGAHVAGSLALLWGNKGRLMAQKDAMVVNAVKTGVFLAAVGTDVYAARLGSEVGEQASSSVDTAAEPVAATPDDLADTRRKLRVTQWALVALTGLNIALGSQMGEQQRPSNVFSGLLERLDPRR